MTFKHDKELNIIRTLFDSTALVEQSDEFNGVILDWDINGKPIGMEILDAADKVELVNDVGAFLSDAGYNRELASSSK